MLSLGEKLVEYIDNKNLQGCKDLLQYGHEHQLLDINALAGNRLILLAAVESRDVAILQLILSQPDLDLEKTEGHELNALQLAAAQETPDMLIPLIEKGANIHVISPHLKITALMSAAQGGCPANCEILLNQQVNASAKSSTDLTALDYAIERVKKTPKDTPEYTTSINILKTLLQAGLALCRDLPPELADLAEVMGHYKDCYFFETTLGKKKITAETPGFELATVLEIMPKELFDAKYKITKKNRAFTSENTPQKKLSEITFGFLAKSDQGKLKGKPPYTQLKLRCLEFLLENPRATTIRELQRCFMLSETTSEGEPVLKLQDFCIQQIARQPNLDLEKLSTVLPSDQLKQVSDIRGLSFEEFEICTSRIEQLEIIHKKARLKNIFRAVAQLVISETILIPSTVIFYRKYNELCPLSATTHNRPEPCGIIGSVGFTLLILLATGSLVFFCLLFRTLNGTTLPETDRQRFQQESEDVPLPAEDQSIPGYIEDLNQYRQSLNQHTHSQNNPFIFFQNVCEERNEVRVEVISDSDSESEEALDPNAKGKEEENEGVELLSEFKPGKK